MFKYKNENVVVAIARDITQRKKAEEDYYKLYHAVEQSPSIVVITDIKGNIEYVNPRFTVITEYTSEEVIGKNANILKSDKVSSEKYKTLWSSVLSGNDWYGTFLNKKKSGEMYWELASISPIRNKLGVITNFVKVSEDFTERKILEDKIGMLATAVEQSLNGVVLTDLEGNIQFCNSAWSEMHGYEIDELMGQNLVIFHPSTYLVNSVINFIHEAKTEGEAKGELTHIKKDGTIFYTIFNLNLLKNENGEEIGLLVVAQDITDRKENDQNIQELNGILELQNKELIKFMEELASTNEKLEIVNRELVIAKDQAEKANKSKSDFLNNISHELRSPLNGILGFSELGLSSIDEDNAQCQEAFEAITNSGRHLLSIINNLLDLAKAEAGKLEFMEEDFILQELIQSSMNIVTPSAREKGLQLDYNIAVDVPQAIISDRSKLRQILVNLLSNGIKFTDTGKIEIFVEVYSENPFKLLFKIVDTGIGISKENQDKIFQAFEQVSNEYTKKYIGTGLGLALCRSFVEIIGGKLWVDSEEDKGSTFSFVIPVKKKETFENKQLEDNLPQINISNAKILIADDEILNVKILQNALKKYTTKLITVSNGQEVIEYLEHDNDIDLILMDLMMPVMDGLACTEILKKTNRTKHIPVIALTARAGKDDMIQCFKSGCNDYMSKPFKIRDLLLTLQKWIFRDI